MSEWVAMTGATGFIGQTICRLLHDEGWKVRALVRSEARAQVLKGVADEWMLGDLDDRVSLEKLIVNVRAVVHCAGAVRGASRQAFDRVNVDGVRNLTDAVLASPYPPRLLCLSSLAAREPRLSFYAASKRKGEQVLEQKAQALNWIALRPPAVMVRGTVSCYLCFDSWLKESHPCSEAGMRVFRWFILTTSPNLFRPGC